MKKKKKKIRFFSSIYAKIATVFLLLLLIFVEIVGAIFIRGLERATITNFETSMNEQVETLATNLSDDMDHDPINTTLIENRILDVIKSNILEIKVINNKGIILASTDAMENQVGEKSDDKLLNEMATKHKKMVDQVSNRRVYINIQPIYSPSGNTVIGALYVKSDLESQYEQVNQTIIIFLTASFIAMVLCFLIALFVARQITRPIGEMQKQAKRISEGDYSEKVKVYGNDELGQLGIMFNELSDRVAEAQEASEGERHRLDSVLEHMTDGVIATDRRGQIIIINETAKLLLNLDASQVLGKSLISVLDLEGKYTLRDLLENKNEMSVDLEVDDSIIKVYFSRIHQESGFISGLVCVLHDITEQEKNEQERRDFVSNVSHELRTPLTSMRSYLEALNEGAWKDEQIAPQFLKVTQDETERMIRMISDLLSLSRIDSDRSPLQLEYINLNKMLDFILNRFEMVIKSENKPYTIQREFTQRQIFIEADNDKLMQVFDNLINNAMKYSPDGGVITVRMLETHDHVIISVSDQGLGIPQRSLNRVFDRFYRVDKARSREMGGTGLGLAIAKEVINQHHGKIWVESIEGYGSTFYISLPYEPFDETEELWN